MFAALGTEFFERQLVLVLFFVLFDAVVLALANGASEFHKLFGNTGHVFKININGTEYLIFF